jgi:hypothetical protein
MSEIKYEHYLPVVLAALTVLLLGCWNPKFIRETKEEEAKHAGANPSYKWLSLFALLVGMLAVWCYNQDK